MRVRKKDEFDKSWEWRYVNLVYDERRGRRNRTTELIKINGRICAFPIEYIRFASWNKKVVSMPIWLARSRRLITVKNLMSDITHNKTP